MCVLIGQIIGICAAQCQWFRCTHVELDALKALLSRQMSMTSERGGMGGGVPACSCCCLHRLATTKATQPVQVGKKSTPGINSATKVGKNNG